MVKTIKIGIVTLIILVATLFFYNWFGVYKPFSMPSLYLVEFNNSHKDKQPINKKFTHLVMPFHIKQMEKVEENIKKWAKYKPCIEEPIEKIRNQMPKFIFYVGYSENLPNVTEKLKVKFAYLLDYLKCFSNGDQIDIVELKIDNQNDNHLLGSMLMLEYMLKTSTTMFANSSYIFYMEPDTRPFRSDWLKALQNEVGLNEFWIRGCSYWDDAQYRDPSQLKYPYHINGNAFYNIGDTEFIKFYFETLKQYVRSKHGDQPYPFDLFVIEYLLDIENTDYSRKVLHKFLYTEVIFNTQNIFSNDIMTTDLIRSYPRTYLSHRYVPSDY
jgi:hypothetical protein